VVYGAFTLFSLFLATTSAIAESNAEIFLSGTQELVSSEELPKNGLLRGEVSYTVNVPQLDGPAEKVERTRIVSVKIPAPTKRDGKFHYRFSEVIGTEGHASPFLQIWGLEEKEGVYTRTDRAYTLNNEAQRAYRCDRNTVKYEMVRESKVLKEMNDFRKSKNLKEIKLSLERITPISREYIARMGRQDAFTPQTGRLKYAAAYLIPVPGSDVRYFVDDKEVRFIESEAWIFANPNVEEADIYIEGEEGKTDRIHLFMFAR
jgi:hypothetical protein